MSERLPKRLSRRDILKLFGAGTVAGVLAGCGLPTSPTETNPTNTPGSKPTKPATETPFTPDAATATNIPPTKEVPSTEIPGPVEDVNIINPTKLSEKSPYTGEDLNLLPAFTTEDGTLESFNFSPEGYGDFKETVKKLIVNKGIVKNPEIYAWEMKWKKENGDSKKRPFVIAYDPDNNLAFDILGVGSDGNLVPAGSSQEIMLWQLGSQKRDGGKVLALGHLVPGEDEKLIFDVLDYDVEKNIWLFQSPFNSLDKGAINFTPEAVDVKAGKVLEKLVVSDVELATIQKENTVFASPELSYGLTFKTGKNQELYLKIIDAFTASPLRTYWKNLGIDNPTRENILAFLRTSVDPQNPEQNYYLPPLGGDEELQILQAGYPPQAYGMFGSNKMLKNGVILDGLRLGCYTPETYPTVQDFIKEQQNNNRGPRGTLIGGGIDDMGLLVTEDRRFMLIAGATKNVPDETTTIVKRNTLGTGKLEDTPKIVTAQILTYLDAFKKWQEHDDPRKKICAFDHDWCQIGIDQRDITPELLLFDLSQ